MSDPLQRNPVLDERWLNRASWWVNHRQGLRHFVIGVLLVIIMGLFALAAYRLIHATFFGEMDRQLVLANLTAPLDYTLLQEHFAPTPLTINTPRVLPERSGEGQYDVLTTVTNPNKQWLATVTYHYVINGASGPDSTTLLLNQETKQLLGAAVATTSSSVVTLEVSNISWRRLHDPTAFDLRKPSLVIEQPEFLGASDVRIKGDAQSPISQARFILKNDSIRGLWSVDLLVIAQTGETAIAARQLTVERVPPNSSRLITVNFPPNIPSNSSLKVMTGVDVSSDSAFMPPQ